jgi:hypothetical protein
MLNFVALYWEGPKMQKDNLQNKGNRERENLPVICIEGPHTLKYLLPFDAVFQTLDRVQTSRGFLKKKISWSDKPAPLCGVAGYTGFSGKKNLSWRKSQASNLNEIKCLVKAKSFLKDSLKFSSLNI